MQTAVSPPSTYGHLQAPSRDFSSTLDDQFVEGDAFANAGGNVDFMLFNSPPPFYDMFVASGGDGDASLFPGSNARISTAEIFADAVGLLVLHNSSAEDTYELTFNFFAFLGASVFGVPGEPGDAFAEGSLELWVDGSLLHSLSVNADLLFGPLDDFADLMDEFTVTLDPMDWLEIEMISSVSGFATAIPVPAALPLLGSALLGMLGLARRRALQA